MAARKMPVVSRSTRVHEVDEFLDGSKHLQPANKHTPDCKLFVSMHQG